ncbi:MAG: extracellular solute-binding protein, partial [Reyranellales bacterium]
IGLGTTSDSVDTVGSIFHGFGAVMVDAKGEIVVKNDQVRQALEYYKKLMQWLPDDVAAWDDASNNKWLVSGQGALIMNPPSAWAVAKRDAPKVAENCWTHGMPAGPKGRFGPFLPFFWGIWNFGKNVPAAKSLVTYLSSPSVVEAMVVASGGYDLPSFENLTKFKVWAEEGPPKGTLFHYPDPFHHQTLSVACAPAPHKIAEQMYNQGIMTQMAVRYFKGEPLEKTLDWASSELEGFMRN